MISLMLRGASYAVFRIAARCYNRFELKEFKKWKHDTILMEVATFSVIFK